MTDVVKVPLSKPIDNNGQSISELAFREPEVGDLLMGDKFETSLSRTVAVLAAISDIPLPVFKKIKGKDFQRIIKDTAGILGNDQTTTTGE